MPRDNRICGGVRKPSSEALAESCILLGGSEGLSKWVDNGDNWAYDLPLRGIIESIPTKSPWPSKCLGPSKASSILGGLGFRV